MFGMLSSPNAIFRKSNTSHVQLFPNDTNKVKDHILSKT